MSIGAVGVGTDKGLEDSQHFFLLAAGKLGCGLEKLAHPPARRKHALGPGFAEEFLDGDAEGFGNGHEDIGARDFSRSLPISDVGMILADLAGEFAQSQSSAFAQFTESGCSFCHIDIIEDGRKNGLHVGSILPTVGQCNRS